MVIKGSARAQPGELALHLLREDTNEYVRVQQLNGVASLDLPGALAELDAMGAGSRSRRTLYHASINTPVAEQLTPEQQQIAIDRLAEKLGLQNQPYIVVEHVKAGRQHMHVVWSRIDVETGKAIPDSHNYRKHEEVARELEIEFGHERVIGAHTRDKENEQRPKRGPTWAEQRQAERSGLTAEIITAKVTELWHQTATGSDFAAAVEAHGLMLARGDKKGVLCLIDPAGELHGLNRRIEGVRAAEVRERMADIDTSKLPSVEEAQQRQRQLTPKLEPENKGFVSASERMKLEEQQREKEGGNKTRESLSGSHGEIADAIYQLNKTMRGQVAQTIANSQTSAAVREKEPPTPAPTLERTAAPIQEKQQAAPQPTPSTQEKQTQAEPEIRHKNLIHPIAQKPIEPPPIDRAAEAAQKLRELTPGGRFHSAATTEQVKQLDKDLAKLTSADRAPENPVADPRRGFVRDLVAAIKQLFMPTKAREEVPAIVARSTTDVPAAPKIEPPPRRPVVAAPVAPKPVVSRETKPKAPEPKRETYVERMRRTRPVTTELRETLERDRSRAREREKQKLP